MAPKKKGGKKKEVEPTEPPHDPYWEKAVETGIWERPVDALPDAMQWPTWGALRERILTSCREIKIVQSSSVRDPFATELVRLSPANLHTLSFKGSDSLESFVLSPLGSCGELKSIDLTGCKRLEYVLIQSDSLETLSVALCGALKTLILHCRGLQRLDVRDCLEMENVIIWSESLDDLDLSSSKKLVKLDLHTPGLPFPKVGRILPKPPLRAPKHKPIVEILKEDRVTEKVKTEIQKAEESQFLMGVEPVPRTYRTM